MRFFILLCVVLCFVGSCIGMTRPQVKKTLQIMKKQCISKVGVPEDKVENIEQGVFIEDRLVMCYIACVYKTLQLVKNNKLDRDLVVKQIDALYPPELKEGTKKGVDKCIHTQDNYSDLCEATFYGAKCLYEFDPPNFIFA
ncbi:general odorant-binding protein 72 [Galleria mellonella]|uniref:General odorant-binding protein 72-like n=2 Tax=Galleria mellonella TaxID=7137 RepID=A0A5C0E4A5_GALME|nr:general odorant-binding protein 72 [Galleria mellonella]QEI46790.1 odorant-binding protein 6 [Galleria mellonella]